MNENNLPKTFSAILQDGATCIATSVILVNGNLKSTLDAKWDTGAYRSFIPKRVVDDLRISPIDTVITRGTFGGNVTVHVFEVDLVIPSGYVFEKLKVLCSLDDSTIDYMLIGMGVISQGDFLFSGYGDGVFSFRVPSEKSISFNLI